MPYTRSDGRFERARSIGHIPIIDNALVQERLRSYRVFSSDSSPTVDTDFIVSADSLGASSSGEIKWIFCFDGSPHEVAVRETFPSTRVGYIQIAGVLVHLDEMLEQGAAQFVDPSIIRQVIQEAMQGMVLPGSNVCRPDMDTVRDSWRADVFEIFRDYKVEGQSLLDIFMLLVGFSDKQSLTGEIVLSRCPCDAECEARNISVSAIERICPECGGRIFPTDALRVYEEVTEEHENTTALGRLMTCLEHITMVGYISYLANRQPRLLGSVGFILDGPLALFGPQAWLHTALHTFICSLRNDLEAKGFRPPVIIGIEKGGQFAEHAQVLGEIISPRTLMALPDDYIYHHILTFRPSPGSSFGRDTYYGQKFFYRTAQGQLLTITVPKLDWNAPDPHNPKHYPWLPSTLELLDRIGTTLYKDAIIPVALAHSFASIPLRTGSRVLKLLSEDLLAS